MLFPLMLGAALAAASLPPGPPGPVGPLSGPGVPDSAVLAWVEPVSGSSGSSVVVSVRVDLSGVDRALGAVRAELRFDPSLLLLEDVGQGGFRGLFQANTDRGADGVVVFAGANPDTALNRGPVTVAELTFRLAGSAGTQAPIRLEVAELVSAGDFRDWTGVVEVREGWVLIH